MSRNLALVMLGDCMLGRVVDESLSSLPRQLAAVWGDTLPLLRGGLADGGRGEAQAVAANLECAVTAAEEADESRAFNFKLHPDNVQAIKNASIDFVCMANNHCLDFKQAGLAESRRALAAAGILHAGVGSPAEAAQPAILERSGLRLALFSYADHFDVWAASEEQPGINYIDPAAFSKDALRRQLAAAQQAGADLTVVLVHWGPNWQWRPSRAVQRLAHAFVESGADIVFGHSAHHIQGVEVYGGCPIIYGAGAFVDDYRWHEDYRNDLGFIYCCHIQDGRPAWLELVPTRIRHTFLEPGRRPPYLSEVHLAAEEEDVEWLRSTLRQLSSPWGTPIEAAAGGRLRIPLQQEGGGRDA